jgi:hypothetical protein
VTEPPETLKRCVEMTHKDCTVTTVLTAWSAVRFYYLYYSHPCMYDSVTEHDGKTHLTYGVLHPTLEDAVRRTSWYGDKQNLVPNLDWTQMSTPEDVERIFAMAVARIAEMMQTFEVNYMHKPYQAWDHTSGKPMPYEDRTRGWLPTEIADFRYRADVRKANITEGIKNGDRLAFQMRCNEWFLMKMFIIDEWHWRARRNLPIPTLQERVALMAAPTPPFSRYVPNLKPSYEFYDMSMDPDPTYTGKVNELLTLERERFKQTQHALNEAIAAEIENDKHAKAAMAKDGMAREMLIGQRKRARVVPS